MKKHCALSIPWFGFLLVGMLSLQSLAACASAGDPPAGQDPVPQNGPQRPGWAPVEAIPFDKDPVKVAQYLQRHGFFWFFLCYPLSQPDAVHVHLEYDARLGCYVLKNGQFPPQNGNPPLPAGGPPVKLPGMGVPGQYQGTVAGDPPKVKFKAIIWNPEKGIDEQVEKELPLDSVQLIGMLIFDHLLRREVHAAVSCCGGTAPAATTEATDFDIRRFKGFLEYLKELYDRWKKDPKMKAKAEALAKLLRKALDLKIASMQEALGKIPSDLRSQQRGGIGTDEQKKAAEAKLKEEMEWLKRARLLCERDTNSIGVPKNP